MVPFSRLLSGETNFLRFFGVWATRVTSRPKNHRTPHGRTLLKDLQLPFGNGELRVAALQTDHKLRKNPDDGFFQPFASGKMDGNFAIEHVLLFGAASF